MGGLWSLYTLTALGEEEGVVSHRNHRVVFPMWNKSLESWLRGPRPAVVERELQPVLERGLAFAVVGPRRAGKTFYLYQLGRPLDVRLVGLRPSHFSSF